MKRGMFSVTLVIVSIAAILATLTHGFLTEISIFHGLVLHPFFLIIAFYLLAYAKQMQDRS
jgi:hypothetical protein